MYKAVSDVIRPTPIRPCPSEPDGLLGETSGERHSAAVASEVKRSPVRAEECQRSLEANGALRSVDGSEIELRNRTATGAVLPGRIANWFWLHAPLTGGGLVTDGGISGLGLADGALP